MKNNSTITSVAFSKFKPTDFEERESTHGWIEYGEGNSYPQYLIDLYYSSSVHNALCNSISQLIAGADVYTADSNANIQIAKWKLHEELSKAATDFKVHGGYSMEIRWSNDRKSLTPKHIPFDTVRSGKADFDEKVRWYWYCQDWTQVGAKDYQPQKIRAFNADDKEDHPVQLMYVAPFTLGSTYYPKPDYFGSVNYIELDSAISEFHLNNIRNGLAPSFMIHFKNGVPDKEERDATRREIEGHLSGSQNAGKFLITYSDDAERKPDFEPMPLSDAHNQYQFLSEECTNKIMIGHRVVSPAMFGVKTAGELGNTEELETASKLFHIQVIQGYQKWLCQTTQDLLEAIGIGVPVTISNSNPFMPQDQQQTEEFSKQSQEDVHEWLLSKGEDAPSGYTLVDVQAVNYDTDDNIVQFVNFASVLAGSEEGDDDQDTPIFKVRYRYAGKRSGNSRDFCTKMLGADKIYKKDDILAASKKTVNPKFGKGGRDQYNIWFYKGGPRCHHYWERVIFLQENNKSITVNQARKLLNSMSVKERDKNRFEVNDWQVAVHPNDMDYKGFHPDNPRIPKDAINKKR